MCNNVISLFYLFFLLPPSGEFFQLFSSDAGTYKEARPFFNPSKTLVTDYFDGNLAQLQQTIHSHTFVFVMYYANFCGISRRMREPYEKAAAFYREKLVHNNQSVDRFHVKFAAIDCFYYEGQCRKTYKLNYYPHMLLYVKGTRGYQYFGPTIKASLIDFIEKIRMPVIRLTTVNDLFDFLVQHESSVLAQFDFSNDLHRQYYSLFTQTALKHIEYDNDHPVRFALILNQTIVEQLSTMYNQTLEKPFMIFHPLNSNPQIFPNLTLNFTIETLFQWILAQSIKPNVSWLVPKNPYYSRSPSMDKSTVHRALTTDDNLLIFLTSNKQDELKLREIYFYLFNCNQSSSFWLQHIHQFNQQLTDNSKANLTNTERHLLSSCCQHFFKEIPTTDIYQICVYNSPYSFDHLSETKRKICSPILKNPKLLQVCYRDYCQQWLRDFTSISSRKPPMNQEFLLQKRKEKFSAQSSSNEQDNRRDDALEKYQGFLCQSNLTWTFRLMNSKLYPNFGRHLGLVNHSRSVLVLQPKNEQYYTLNHRRLTTENIYDLISDITRNVRSRTYASIPVDHMLINKSSNRLIELSTQRFQTIVFDAKKHVLVVYYTKWCGFCQSIWPVLYQTKAFFQNFDDLIFTRIQADKHDLPWYLTVYNYPTIILFPANRKSHSIAYPSTIDSLTSVNLIKFLLYHLYIDNNISPQEWCPRANNTFFSMLSSTYIDFSQLSYLIQSYS